jgi:hypothetical protein
MMGVKWIFGLWVYCCLFFWLGLSLSELKVRENFFQKSSAASSSAPIIFQKKLEF